MSLFRPRDDGRAALPSRIFHDNQGGTAPLPRAAAPEQAASFIQKLWRRSDDCKDFGDTREGCKSQVSPNVTTMAIVLGIVIPIVCLIFVLIFLHRRNMKRLKLEDANDANRDLDFGLDLTPSGKKGRKSILFGGEKQSHKAGQLSMDMNLSSPYLLPPTLNQSQDSIQSLARTFHNEPHDPYRAVSQYANSEAGSIRSFNPNRDKSGRSSNAPSYRTGKSMGGTMVPPPRTNSMPRPPVTPGSPTSPLSLREMKDPFATPTVPEPTHQAHATEAVHDSMLPVQPIVPEIGNIAYPDDKPHGGLEMPDIQSPPPALSRDLDHVLPNHPQDTARFELPSNPLDANIGMAHGEGDFLPHANQQPKPAGLGLDLEMPRIMSPPIEEPHGYHGEQPQIQTSQYYDEYGYDGAEVQHQHMGHPQSQQQGLGVPVQENSKRLSVGFRPLPPDEVTESEDPEYRANRIRSFYKEYFEEPNQPAPPMPKQRAEYYEDYDQNYLGDAAYYDADTNAFVMPYAQPVTRRAMTPPPVGRNRGPPGRGGPRGPHGPHGSLGGMSLPGGPRRPRAGSAFSPRPGSSASAGFRQPPKKRGPPPTDLTTLPTPSKLKDDMFGILNPLDFAPPETIKDHAAGRSQSPLGERRPYQQPSVPVASPLVTAFDELAALPSPFQMRKSSTFTGLDFAPPKKFKDADTMSDAGSIKSNRTGISQLQLGAIRSGAGRISRLPGDTVFTQAALAEQLRPQWGVRPS